jgi:T-complex protein 1 subunit gamma
LKIFFNILLFCYLLFIILGGEILSVAEPLLERNFHPTIIVQGYIRALQIALQTCQQISRHLDIENITELRSLVTAGIGTKFSSRWSEKMVEIAITAVKKIIVKRRGYNSNTSNSILSSSTSGVTTLTTASNSTATANAAEEPTAPTTNTTNTNTTSSTIVNDYTEVDIKRFIRIEKIPGGDLHDCQVLNGVMFEKDVTHAKMRRHIENPRILLLDCPLEYKKGESQTNVEIMNEEDFNSLLRQEEEYIEQLCANVR